MGSAALPYTVRFENVSTATAAAQKIIITQQLDSDLDFRTFRIQEFGFRSFRFNVDGGHPSLTSDSICEMKSASSSTPSPTSTCRRAS